MIQVKEFVDTEISFAQNKANEFLATLDDDQVINVCYGSVSKSKPSGIEHQRSTILIVYRLIKPK